MKLKEFLTISTPKKKDTNLSINSSSAAISIINQTDYLPLSKIESLNEASSIIAKGVWNCNDFTILKNKLRVSSPLYMANTVLKEINLENIKLDNSYNSISYKELFNFCVNLSLVILPNASSFKGEVNFHATFRGCGKLKEIHNLSTYRHISDLRGTFCYCTLLSKVELLCTPLPTGDSETFQKVNRDIQVIVPQNTRIPMEWGQLGTENIHYYPSLSNS